MLLGPMSRVRVVLPLLVLLASLRWLPSAWCGREAEALLVRKHPALDLTLVSLASALAAALVARRELGTSRSDSTAAQAIRLLAELALIGGAYFAINTVRTPSASVAIGM